MTDPVRDFYDGLAEHYHLIFENWERSIDRQGTALDALIAPDDFANQLDILDCACGIGTQSIALAKLGYRVTGVDLSPAAIARARSEAEARELKINFSVDDMTSLKRFRGANFDVVMALDNALPHLASKELSNAAKAIRAALKPDGSFIASVRDYDQIVIDRPTTQQPAFYSNEGVRRIVHQVWDWLDDTRYVVHLYITLREAGSWRSLHFVSEYRCLLREELSELLRDAGFVEITWLMPYESGFYQPIVVAKTPQESSK